MEKKNLRNITAFFRSLWFSSRSTGSNPNYMSVSRVSKINMTRPMSGSAAAVSKKQWSLDICRWSSTKSNGNHLDNDHDEKIKKKISLMDKIKIGWDKYGILGVATYLSLNMCTFGSIYCALEWDIFNAAAVGLDPVIAVTNVSLW